MIGRTDLRVRGEIALEIAERCGEIACMHA